MVYMGFDEMDHVNLRAVHQSEDVKNVFKQYCQQGISPTLNGGGGAYRNRISELVSARRSFVKYQGTELIFKAEVGTVGAGVAQIQGVWVKPEYRGQGISVPAMAAVVKLVLADLAPVVSLYVNDYNEVALNSYRSVGFEQVDTFATVLFN